MNPLLSKLTGAVDENLVPVIANRPRSSYMNRLRAKRKIGESDDGSLIPDNAKEVDVTGTSHVPGMSEIKTIVQEPSYPGGEKEKYITPYSALTAPDVTPDAMTPIDPSKVPGIKGDESTFTWQEIEEQPEKELPAPDSGTSNAMRAMDTILGRKRTGTPAKNAQEFAAAGNIATEAQALNALGIDNPAIMEAAAAKAAAALQPNISAEGDSVMPEHKASNGKAVCDMFRKFM